MLAAAAQLRLGAAPRIPKGPERGEEKWERIDCIVDCSFLPFRFEFKFLNALASRNSPPLATQPFTTLYVLSTIPIGMADAAAAAGALAAAEAAAGGWQAQRNAETLALLEEVGARAVTFDEMEVGRCYANYQGRIMIAYQGYLKSKRVLETKENGTRVYLLTFKRLRRFKDGKRVYKKVFETERVPNASYDHYYEFPCDPDDDPFERRVHLLAARMKTMRNRNARRNNGNKSRSNNRSNNRNKSRSNNRSKSRSKSRSNSRST